MKGEAHQPKHETKILNKSKQRKGIPSLQTFKTTMEFSAITLKREQGNGKGNNMQETTI